VVIDLTLFGMGFLALVWSGFWCWSKIISQL